MGYRLRAARRCVDVSAIEVVVETDSHVAGLLDPHSGRPAGFESIRYHVTIASNASSAEIDALVDEADALSPIVDALARANFLSRRLTVLSADEPEGGA
jgi:OsmC-like protein